VAVVVVGVGGGGGEVVVVGEFVELGVKLLSLPGF